jgi:transcription-repair coupling factor (superfamily II helicase)
VEKLDAGPKGLVLSFRGQNFANPGGLITWIQGQKGAVKLRPDAKLSLIRDMDLAERVKRARDLLRVLARLAGEAKRV